MDAGSPPTVTAVADVVAGMADEPAVYDEFLRVPAMSAGVYRIRAGAHDGQRPHHEDEIYYVVSGRGQVRVGADDHDVRAGDVVFVAATVEHRFHDVTEDLTLLVFFAPPESG